MAFACLCRQGRSGMEHAAAILFVVVIALVFGWRSVNSIKKGRQAVRGRNRCEACGSRFVTRAGRQAGTCRRCGARQNWTSQ